MHAKPTVEDAPRARLKQFIEAESDWLFKTLRWYVYRAGLNQEESFVNELVDQVVVEALDHAGRFDPARSPKAWLLGIGANLIKRRQAHTARLERREPLVGDLGSVVDASLSEDELFDRLGVLSGQDLEQDRQDKQQILAAWVLLAPHHQEVIRLFVLFDLDGNALARELNVTPGAARVRLHRALNRLRHAWRAGLEDKNDE
jgi:RNA polymerase sigma factor (sigma-70 family)